MRDFWKKERNSRGESQRENAGKRKKNMVKREKEKDRETWRDTDENGKEKKTEIERRKYKRWKTETETKYDRNQSNRE